MNKTLAIRWRLIGAIVAFWGVSQASAQTLTISGGLVSYEIAADYTPSGSPAESASYIDSFDPQSQPSFDFSVNLFGGNMAVDFDLAQSSGTAFSFISQGRTQFEVTQPTTFDVSATTTYTYSILFELDSAGFLELMLGNLSSSNPLFYSPFSPPTSEGFSLEYFSSGVWVELASYTGSGHSVAPVIDLENIAVDAGEYRLTGTGVANAGTSKLLASVAVSPAPVPEPSFLVFAGVAGLLALTTRRR